MFEQDSKLHIGTSSWSSQDWVGPFYPEKMQPSEFIEYYARIYDTVEIDATFYRMPTKKNVEAWKRNTPEGFLFAVKTPQIITHEKKLVDATDDMSHFLETIQGLESRLGPILLQFPYFNKQAFEDKRVFFDRLNDFLSKLPKGFKIAIEIRNKTWLVKDFLKLCRENRAVPAWIYQAWMPEVNEWLRLLNDLPGDFAYLRWLGDHKAIEQITTKWDQVVIDRKQVIIDWTGAVKTLREKQIEVFGYFNNHFAGYAPKSVEMFREEWVRLRG